MKEREGYIMLPRRPRIHTYVVYGEPASLCRRRGWSDHKHTRMKWEIELTDQQDEKALFTGPISIDLTFYFPIPPRSRTSKTVPGAYYPHKPDVYGFLAFFHEVAQSIVYENDAVVTAITCRKMYDDVPRTEFTITEIIR